MSQNKIIDMEQPNDYPKIPKNWEDAFKQTAGMMDSCEEWFIHKNMDYTGSDLASMAQMVFVSQMSKTQQQAVKKENDEQ